MGSKANPAIKKTHLATPECATSAGGRLLQRIRKRYAQMTGTNHPKLYCGSTAQCCERGAMSIDHSAPKTTIGTICCISFWCCPTLKISSLELRSPSVIAHCISSYRHERP